MPETPIELGPDKPLTMPLHWQIGLTMAALSIGFFVGMEYKGFKFNQNGLITTQKQTVKILDKLEGRVTQVEAYQKMKGRQNAK